MTPRRKAMLRLALGLGFCLLGWKAWRAAGDDPILLLLLCLGGGVIFGFIVVMHLLPRLADAIGTALFLSGEQLPPPSTPRDADASPDHPASPQEPSRQLDP